MEEVKALLKTLSNEQKEEVGRKESNDRVTFFPSGRIEDRIMMVCEKRGSSESMPCEESELDSTSDEEGAEEMPPLTDSEMSDIEEEEGDRAVPPLTDGENSESEKEVEDLSNEERGAEDERNLNLEPSREVNKN